MTAHPNKFIHVATPQYDCTTEMLRTTIEIHQRFLNICQQQVNNLHEERYKITKRTNKRVVKKLLGYLLRARKSAL
jgi:hypothetical protein